MSVSPSNHNHNRTTTTSTKESQPLPLIPPGVVIPQPDFTSEPIDPDEPTYCLCNQVSFGEMIGCDNEEVSHTHISSPTNIMLVVSN